MEKDKHHRFHSYVDYLKKQTTVTENRAVVMGGGEDKCVKEADCTVTGGK